MTPGTPSDDAAALEVVILAPTGQDATLLASALASADMASVIAVTAGDLAARVQRGAGAVLVAEEALDNLSMTRLQEALQQQPPWSDIPVVVMTSGGSTTLSSARVMRLLAPSGSVVLIERPFRPLTLVSTLKVALRARQRQYQARGLLELQERATQERDEFISVASHELKTPLTSMKMQAQLALRLMERGLPAEELAAKLLKLLEATHGQIDNLTRLVDDMLDVTRISSGKLSIEKERFDLSELVRSLVSRFEPVIAGARCKAHLAATPGIVGSWDKLRTEQVVSNLLTNAARYAPGGNLWISVTRTEAGARLSVRDEGPGIAPDKREKIFERFERATAKVGGRGLGLGLYICRRIVEAHQGTIHVESAPGKGSEFIVDLPLESETAYRTRST